MKFPFLSRCPNPAKPPQPGGPPVAIGDLRSDPELNIQLSADDVSCLTNLASNVPAGQLIVELGSYQGGSTAVLALAAAQGNHNPVYAVDPHTDFVGPRGKNYGPPDMEKLYQNLTRLGLGQRVFVVCLPSGAAAKAWDAQNIGLLWADGDHRYEAIRADIDAWRPYVVPGGIIALHDTDLPDVQRAMNEAARRGLMRRLGQLGKITWFARLP